MAAEISCDIVLMKHGTQALNQTVRGPMFSDGIHGIVSTDDQIRCAAKERSKEGEDGNGRENERGLAQLFFDPLPVRFGHMSIFRSLQRLMIPIGLFITTTENDRVDHDEIDQFLLLIVLPE